MKKYIQPTCLVINLVPEHIIAQSLNINDTGGDQNTLTRRRLWDDDAE